MDIQPADTLFFPTKSPAAKSQFPESPGINEFEEIPHFKSKTSNSLPGMTYSNKYIPTSPSAQTKIKTNGSLLKVRIDSGEDSLQGSRSSAPLNDDLSHSWTLPRTNFVAETISWERNWRTLPLSSSKNQSGNVVSNRKADDSFPKIIDICGKLKELDVEEGEILMELQLEKALISSLSPVPDDILSMESRLLNLEEELVECQTKLIALRQKNSDGKFDSQIISTEEDYEQKRREYDDLEYQLLEKKAMRETDDGRNLFDGGTFNQQILLESLMNQADHQRDLLRVRRQNLLDQQQRQYESVEWSNVGVTESSSDSQKISWRRRTGNLPQNRPLTRYLPQEDPKFDLLIHLESCGHAVNVDDSYPRITSHSCSGYLLKKSRRLKHIWRKKWFVFDRSTRELSYRRLCSDVQNDGMFPFEDLLDVYVVHQSSSGGKIFCVTFLQGDKIILKASNVSIMRIWIDCIITGTEGSNELILYE